MKRIISKVRTYPVTSFLLIAIFISVFVTLQWSCNDNQSVEKSLYLNHNDSVKYVGMQTCQSCHAAIYNSFIQTGMGSSFGLATRIKSAANFGTHHVVFDKYNNFYYYPFWRNDSMFISEFRLKEKDTIYKRTEYVKYIIGSGQHTNSHLMEVNGYIYQLPLTWYSQSKKWDLPPGFEKGRNVRFNRDIGFECMSCHNALPDFVENSTNKFTNIPQGIDCERCHGPGEMHVKERLTGSKVDTSQMPDYTIVNPKRLTWELQTDICQRCHLQGNAVVKHGKSFSDFRPGKHLSDYMDIYMPKYIGHEEEFIMASHAQRLQMSKCFINADQSKALTCITCHNPHVSVKVTGKQIFNNACIQCHQDNKTCTETTALRMAKEDNCWGCHMPKSGTIDIPHVTVTDHFIRKPLKKRVKDELKIFAGIYCINNKSSDQETKAKAYLAYREKFEGEMTALDSAEKIVQSLGNTENSNIVLRIHLLFLRNDYLGIIRLIKNIQIQSLNDPWTCYRIGQSYQNVQQNEMAYSWYAEANRLAPENLDFANKQGAILIAMGKVEEGIRLLETLIKTQPKQPEVLTNIGFGYVVQKQYELAMRYYDQSLSLNPDMQQTLYNKAALCNLLGRKMEAKAILLQLLKKDPTNNQLQQILETI